MNRSRGVETRQTFQLDWVLFPARNTSLSSQKACDEQRIESLLLGQEKTVYRVKNWSTCNRALIAPGSLTLWVDESVVSSWYYEGPSQRGAQYTYSDQAIEMALTLRRLLNLGLRQTQRFVESLWTLMGLDEVLAVPDY